MAKFDPAYVQELSSTTSGIFSLIDPQEEV